MKNNLVLLLGTNEGDRKANLTRAHQLLNDKVGDIMSKSSVYETAAWGKEDQPTFYNQVIFINTHFDAADAMQELIHIEETMGRKRGEKWISRIIDIDILYFNNEVIESDGLKIPHPMMHLRKFTLAPLAEILPGFTHPTLHLSSKELLAECKDKLTVTRLKS